LQRDPDYWSSHAVAERRHVGERVAAILRLARGDPRLSFWEEGFLASIADILRRTGGAPSLSDKQLAVLLNINDKVMAEPELEADAA
jgi:hypothetical protein